MGYHKCPRPKKVFHVVNNDSLYRVIEVQGEEVYQLLIPQSFRHMILQSAYNDALGGYLGAEKTEAWITDWLGVTVEVKRYCGSCPTCHLTAPLSLFRNPLVPLPIIMVPFELILMDLVGLLVKLA